MTKWLRTNNYI